MHGESHEGLWNAAMTSFVRVRFPCVLNGFYSEQIKGIKVLTTVSPRWKWASCMLLIYSCPLDWIKNSHLRIRKMQLYNRRKHGSRTQNRIQQQADSDTLETIWRAPAKDHLPAPSSWALHRSRSTWRCHHDLPGCTWQKIWLCAALSYNTSL